MKKVKKQEEPNIEKLQKEVEVLNKRIHELEESRENVLLSCRNTNRELKKKLEETRTGALQARDICNSLLMWVAYEQGGEIRVPDNHMELTKEWEYKTGKDPITKEYLFRVRRNEE